MSRSDFTLMHDVSIDSLLLDIGNPRIRTATDQPTCFEKVLKKEEQMLKLMTSIATNGLSTAQILISSSSEQDKFVVKDGNRRVAALKLLQNPTLCLNLALREKIVKIGSGQNNKQPNLVDCLFSDNAEAIAFELRLRHNGELGGEGQMNWSAYLRTIHFLDGKVNNPDNKAALLLLWAEEHGVEVSDEFPITTLTRIINAASAEKLGFEITADKLSLKVKTDLALKIIGKVIDDLTDRITVNHVFTKELANKYVDEVLDYALPKLSKDDSGIPKADAIESSATEEQPLSEGQLEKRATRPFDENSSAEPIEADANYLGKTATNQNDKASFGDSVNGENGAQAKPVTRPPSKASWDRKKLYNKSTQAPKIPTSEKKAKDVVYELSILNDIQKAPICLALLTRVLIELSTNYYMKRHNITDKQKLSSNISSVCDSMKTKGIISDSLVSLIKAYTVTDKSSISIFNIDTLQKYIHRDTHLPNSQTIIKFYDEISPYICICWQ